MNDLSNILIPRTTLPNVFPLNPTPQTLAIITDAPEQNDITAGQHFSTLTGGTLFALGQTVGLARATCFLGSITQSPDLSAECDLPALATDLTRLNPNCCLLLGQRTFSNAFPAYKLDSYRGSILISPNANSPLFGRKCIGTYHPRDIVRDYTLAQITRFDISRALRESRVAGFEPPRRDIVLIDSPDAFERLYDVLCANDKTVSLDIEGGINTMSCISFATDPQLAYVLPFVSGDGSPRWSDSDEVRIWTTLRRLLSNPALRKCLQNHLYDAFVLAYSYKTLIRGLVDDTMLKHWELLSELPKGLGFQASIYTNEPFYKAERKSADFGTFLRYNGKDSAVTCEINNLLSTHIHKRPESDTHYRFNLALLRPLLYMELRGIRYDLDEVHNAKNQLTNELNVHQTALDTIAGAPVNIRSPKFKHFLYETLALPKQYKKTKMPSGGYALRVTTDYEALLKLQKSCPHPAVAATLRITRLRTLAQMLCITADSDGRIRCGYNVVGTETGRLTSYTSPTGSGYNLQTIPDEDPAEPEDSILRPGLRRLFRADPDCELVGCDLAGADGWTVAARCATLGDATMLEDYLYGLKPAKILALMLEHGPDVASWDRPRLKEASVAVKKGSWQYFVCKVVQHGSNYLMGSTTVARNVFLQSNGTVSITSAQADRIQQLYFIRYRGVKQWHSWMATQLRSKRTVSASGHERIYFGRTTDILGQALANEPQENTTYATNLALFRLWTDPTNRYPNGSLLVEPLHHGHDALLTQHRIADRDYALGSLVRWFDNPIRVGAITLRIPFEGAYGDSWGTLINPIPSA